MSRSLINKLQNKYQNPALISLRMNGELFSHPFDDAQIFNYCFVNVAGYR